MKPRALIVDDERAECEMFADALRDAGFDPSWDVSPVAALTRLGRGLRSHDRPGGRPFAALGGATRPDFQRILRSGGAAGAYHES